MVGPVFLEGETVELRTIEEEDLDFLNEYANDLRIWPYTGIPAPINSQQEREFFENVISGGDAIHLLIATDGTPVGMVGINRIDERHGLGEIGYWVVPGEHGQGYATEATELLVSHAFDALRLHKIAANVYEGNDASMAVLAKLGFTEEGVLRDEKFIDGEYRDRHRFGVLEAEWRERTA